MIDFETLIPEQLKNFLYDEQAKKYLVRGGIAAAIILYAVFAIVPKFVDFSNTRREVKELDDKITTLNSRVKRLDLRTKQLNGLRAELEGYSEGLPGQTKTPEFLEYISNIAKTSSVKILSVTPSELKTIVEETGEDNKYYREVLIAIAAKSGYHQLGHFLSSLEKGKRFITIETLRIRHDGKFPRRHDIKIKVKTYVEYKSEKN